MTPVPDIVVRRRCTECGHEQDVESACSYRNPDGSISRYFGSAHDFCNKCDGPMVDVEEKTR